MKTNIIGLIAALFTITSPISVATAGVALPRSKSAPVTSPAKPTDCCLTQVACSDKSCCVTKTVSNTNPGGRSNKVSSFLTYKKVKDCTQDCKVMDAEQQAVCHKGTKS